MTVGTDKPVVAEMVRDFLEGLRAGAELDTHPLTTLLLPLPGFCRHEDASSNRERAAASVARGLRAVWRERFIPPVLNAGLQVGWNAYFILEVLYFYPFAKTARFPGTLKEAAMRLCDTEHLALIVADGDKEQARKLIDDNQTFWARFIPANMTPAEQTLHSRRDASLRKLARELNRLFPAMPDPAPEQRDELTRQGDKALLASLAEADDQLSPSNSAFYPSQQPSPEEPPPAAEILQAGDSEPSPDTQPLSPHVQRLLNAYEGSTWPTGSRNSAFLLGRPLTHPQVLLQQVVELGPAVTPAHLDELAPWLWQLRFPQSLGVEEPVTGGVWWWNEEHLQRRLVEVFQTTHDDADRLHCAAALRQSSLTVAVKERVGQWPFWNYRWVPALEVVADMALTGDRGTGRHAVAVAVLTKYDFVLRLMAGDHVYHNLAQYISGRLQPVAPGSG